MPAEADSPNPPARRGRWRDWLVNLLILLAIFGSVQWWRGRPLASGEAPPLAGTAVDGQPLDLRTLRGAPVLIHFWATWCPVCKLGQGAVDAIARDHRVVTVAMQSGDAAEVRRFMAEQGLRFPALPDADGGLASRWGVGAVPASFVLDGEGRIAYATLGLSSESGLRARLWAAGLGGAAADTR